MGMSGTTRPARARGRTRADGQDIPRVSSRTFLYNYMLQHRNEIPDHYVETDNYSHQNQKGHQYMADISESVKRVGGAQGDPVHLPRAQARGTGVCWAQATDVISERRVG